MTILGQTATGPLPNYTIIAQAIRDAAGIPSTETVGVRVTPGLTSTSLTDKDGNVAISNAAAASSFADSGAGTEAEPYLVDSKRFDNSEGVLRCVNFTSTDVYHMEFRNCWFSGYDSEVFRIASTNNFVTFRNCLFTYDDTTADPADTQTNYLSILTTNVSVNLIACLASSGGRSWVITSGTYSGTITMTDCQCDESDAAWTGTGVMVETLATANHSVVLQNCTVDSMAYGMRITNIVTFTVNNCDLNHIVTGGISTSLSGTVAISGTVLYSSFRDNRNIAISLESCDGIEISYSEFEDTLAPNSKQIYWNGSAGYVITNTETHHCKFTKGGSGSGENWYGYYSINCVIHDCWSDDCGNDCYELYRPQSGNQIYDCVGDNAAGQICDIYHTHPTAPGNDTIVSGIYGNCGDIGVHVTGNITCHVSNVHVDTTEDAVQLRQLDILDPTGPFNCQLYGPFENSLGDRYGTFVNTGSIGAGNTIGGVIGVDSI